MKFRLRPSASFIQQANWEQLYLLTEHWKIDMQFFGDELRFFDDLINRYRLWVEKDENIDKVNLLVQSVQKLKNVKREVEIKIDTHLRHIEQLIEHTYPSDSEEFRNEHEQLEQSMTEYLHSFRAAKSHIFQVSEEILEEENLEQVIRA